MNWMTSGRHRAMYSKNGRRRQKMHFPITIQQERLDLRALPHHQSTTVEQHDEEQHQQPWYQLDFENQEESLDVQILEFGRTMYGKKKKNPATTATISHEKVQKNDKNILNQINESPVKNQSKETERCVFTPIKNTKKPPIREQQKTKHTQRLKLHSSHDILLINDGEQVSHPQSIKQPSIDSQPIESISFQQNHLSTAASNQFTTAVYESNDKSPNNESRARFTPPDNCYLTNRMVDKFPEESFQEQEQSTLSLGTLFPVEQEGRMLSPIPFVLSSQEEMTSPSSPSISSKKRAKTTLPFSEFFELPVPEETDKLLLELPPIGWQAKTNQIETDILNQIIQAPSQDLQSTTLTTGTNTPFALSVSSIEGSQGSHLSSEVDLIPPPGMLDLFKESLKTGKLKIPPIQNSLSPILKDKGKMIPVQTVDEESSNGISPTKRQKITSWRMSSRTTKLFQMFQSTIPSNQTKPSSSSLSTHSKYLEMENVAVYMSTIVQCYKINEKIAEEIKIQQVLQEEPEQKET